MMYIFSFHDELSLELMQLQYTVPFLIMESLGRGWKGWEAFPVGGEALPFKRGKVQLERKMENIAVSCEERLLRLVHRIRLSPLT